MHTKNTQKFLVMFAILAVAFMVFAVVMMVSVPAAQAAEKQCAYAHSARTLAQNRAAVYCIMNAERALEGIRPYSSDWRSELAAQRHSQDMVKRGYYSHYAPQPAPYGRFNDERMRAAGWPAVIYDPSVEGWPNEVAPDKYTYEMMALEMIGQATSPYEMVKGWLASPDHCGGIMDLNGDAVGIGESAGLWTFEYMAGWRTFQTGIEIPWDRAPSCPRKPRTNHPPTLRVVKAVRRGKQLTVRLKTNMGQNVLRVKVLPQNSGRTVKRKVRTNMRGKAVVRFRVQRGARGFVFADLIVGGKKLVTTARRF